MSAPDPAPEFAPVSLRDAARAVVAAAVIADKLALADATAALWRTGTLPLLDDARDRPLSERPGRPDRPELLPPNRMPRRSTGGPNGRIALLHALAHIELNAVDLAFDILGRFADPGLPRQFHADWLRVGVEEALHFRLLAARLAALGAAYGDLPAHDGLWDAARVTSDTVLARLAIVPMVLEARGLDVTPLLISKMRRAGDAETVAALEVIYRDEQGHVGFGVTWFLHVCARDGLEPMATWQDIVRARFRGRLKPPFNAEARAKVGMAPELYQPLAEEEAAEAEALKAGGTKA